MGNVIPSTAIHSLHSRYTLRYSKVVVNISGYWDSGRASDERDGVKGEDLEGYNEK